MGAIIFFAIILFLIINYFIAVEFYKVAEMKGYTEKKYLWIPFFFGVIGYLLIIALPITPLLVKSFSELNNVEEEERKLPEL